MGCLSALLSGREGISEMVWSDLIRPGIWYRDF